MKIIDSFLFYRELDVLELRLATHYTYVDKFVILESDRTFTNKEKSFNFESNYLRFERWSDKISYIKLTGSAISTDPWINEAYQRDQLNRGYSDLSVGDALLISDVDEIICPEALELIRIDDLSTDVYILNLALFYFKVNYFCRNYPWNLPKIFRYNSNNECDIKNGAQYLRSSTEFRNRKVKTINHAGWHFSFIGDESDIVQKLQAYSHQEMNNGLVKSKIDIETLISKKINLDAFPM